MYYFYRALANIQQWIYNQYDKYQFYNNNILLAKQIKYMSNSNSYCQKILGQNSKNKQNIVSKVKRNIPPYQKCYNRPQVSSYSKKARKERKVQKIQKWNSSSRVLLMKCQNTKVIKNSNNFRNEDLFLGQNFKGNVSCSRPVKVLRQIVKFPRIKQDSSDSQLTYKRKSRSVKKIDTEPCENINFDQHLITATLSPKDSYDMKEKLLGIVKSKQNRHLISIDEQIDKLQILTKRYSCLRKDLTSIQEDILTISFKQMQKQNRQSSQTASSVYL